MNHKKLILPVLVVVFAGVAFFSMRDMLTPYVPFNKAMESGDYVQIIGSRDRQAKPVHGEGYFSFTLKNKTGAVMKVRHKGSKPLNFEHAEQVVAMGTYDRDNNLFEADKILVKCPSKYTRENKK